MWWRRNYWKRHKVQLLDRESIYVISVAREQLKTPMLDVHIARWEKQFPDRDREPHKLGVINRGKLGDNNFYFIHCAPVSWAQYVVSYSIEQHLLPRKEQFEILAQSCLVRARDDAYMLVRRSAMTQTHQNLWHVSSAGYIERQDVDEWGSPLDAVRREIDEEVNLQGDDIGVIEMSGLCKHPIGNSAIIEFCCETRSRLSSSEILERSRTARDTWEGKHHAFHESEIRTMLQQEKFHPAGAATMLLHLGL